MIYAATSVVIAFVLLAAVAAAAFATGFSDWRDDE